MSDCRKTICVNWTRLDDTLAKLHGLTSLAWCAEEGAENNLRPSILSSALCYLCSELDEVYRTLDEEINGFNGSADEERTDENDPD